MLQTKWNYASTQKNTSEKVSSDHTLFYLLYICPEGAILVSLWVKNAYSTAALTEDKKNRMPKIMPSFSLSMTSKEIKNNTPLNKPQ